MACTVRVLPFWLQPGVGSLSDTTASHRLRRMKGVSFQSVFWSGGMCAQVRH